jgi:hypothetical protein
VSSQAAQGSWFVDQQEPVPRDVADAIEASGLPAPGRRERVSEFWQQALSELERSPDQALAERLLWLTASLYDPCTSGQASGEDAYTELVADVERVLELLSPTSPGRPTSPSEQRHGQILRGLLSRAASRAGELTAAEAWLAGCDPSSEDDDCRASQRLAVACLATRRGDFAKVLAVLDRALLDSVDSRRYEIELSLFRANALERTGDQRQAFSQLRSALGRLRPWGSRAMVQIHRAYAQAGIELCPASHATAQLEHALALSGSAPHWYNARLGLLLMGLLVLLIGGGMVLAGGFADDRVGSIVALVFTAGVLIGTSYAGHRSAMRDARVRGLGVPSVARLQRATPTGGSVNDMPRVELALRVLVGAEWRPVRVRWLIHPLQMSRFVSGATLPVRVAEGEGRRVSLALELE